MTCYNRVTSLLRPAGWVPKRIIALHNSGHLCIAASPGTEFSGEDFAGLSLRCMHSVTHWKYQYSGVVYPTAAVDHNAHHSYGHTNKLMIQYFLYSQNLSLSLERELFRSVNNCDK